MSTKNKILIVTTFIVIVVIVVQALSLKNTREKLYRTERNLSATQDTVKTYKLKNGSYMSEIKSFEVTKSELKKINNDRYKSLKSVRGDLSSALEINYRYQKKIDSLGKFSSVSLKDTTYKFSDHYSDSSLYVSVSNLVTIDSKKGNLTNRIFFDSVAIDGTMNVGTTPNNVFVNHDSNTTIDMKNYNIPSKKRIITLGIGAYIGVGYDPFKEKVVYSGGAGLTIIPERLNLLRKINKWNTFWGLN